MKKTIAVLILVFLSMASMADENRVNGKIQPDTSGINAKLEQIVNDRLRAELTVTDAELVKQSETGADSNLLMQTMNFFKVDTSLPE